MIFMLFSPTLTFTLQACPQTLESALYYSGGRGTFPPFFSMMRARLSEMPESSISLTSNNFFPDFPNNNRREKHSIKLSYFSRRVGQQLSQADTGVPITRLMLLSNAQACSFTLLSVTDDTLLTP